ncbi:MAG: transglutaminase family protein [Candidatus Eremiobacteraeota bacterium]|nr:transglutaminase family protein [Candidatus Eremiobacteraeota bacterium]
MTSIVQHEPLEAYLRSAPLIDVDAPEIGEFVDANLGGCTPTEAARRVFHFVRDQVAHSWDAQQRRVTRSATETLRYREGICYAKSHLVAALLRRHGVPTAVCYQRLTLLDDDSAGYALHALNAAFLEGGWYRFDARGNKPGVDAQFSPGVERLAFPIRPHFDEIDYPELYAEPHPRIVETLTTNDDALLMYRERLPARL